MDSFSYAWCDPQQRLQAYHSWRFESETFPNLNQFGIDFTQVIDNQSKLLLPNREVLVGLNLPRRVYVPNRLYNPDAAKTYLEHGLELAPGEAIRTEEVPHQAAKIVYALPERVADWLNRYFRQARTVHISTAFLKVLPDHYRQGRWVIAHVWDRQLLLFFLEEGRLIFENSFSCHHAKDFLYYILLVYDQFQLNPMTVPIALSGHLAQDSEIFRLVFRYIQHLEFLELGKTIQFGPKLGEQPRYFYNDLLALLEFS